MKKDIHPKYYKDAEIVCACGNKFNVGSTKLNIRVEICSSCHPYFTGADKFIDKAGRVDKFKAKMSRYQAITDEKQKKVEEKARKKKEAEELLRSRKK